MHITIHVIFREDYLLIPTSPLIQDLRSDDLYGQCGSFAEELQGGLVKEHLLADAVFSANRDSNGHVYLTTNVKDVEILIDPTIIQFLEGHKHVFVGTRNQLHKLVTEQTGEGKPYQIVHTKSRNNPEEAFQRIWGSKSRVYFHPRIKI